MGVGQEEAIRLATTFANANGYRVVASFGGLVWRDGPRPVKLDAARWIDGEWAVVFDKLPPPEVESECPGDMCVVVTPEGGACRMCCHVRLSDRGGRLRSW
jgi:hypothetical protein